MRILLLGEYSNVHNTLAEGLREAGHEATVASNGDFWKCYPRDIDLSRRGGKVGGLALWAKLNLLAACWKGYDVVQVINPMFAELKAERLAPLLRRIAARNGLLSMGAYGIDAYYVKACTDTETFRYSDFNIGSEVKSDSYSLRQMADWTGTAKEALNRETAGRCGLIAAGLYEYWRSYQPEFPGKTRFIPFPIRVDPLREPRPVGRRLKVFVGISKGRSVYKGTDIMLRAAMDAAAENPGRVDVEVAEGLPFAEYRERMEGCDVVLDQLYGYSPAMNALLAMGKGMVCVGGGEEEHYRLMGEDRLRPVVNVQPSYQSVKDAVSRLARDKALVADLKRQGLEYVAKHHDHLKVARRYAGEYAAAIARQVARAVYSGA